jgi:hypothetical protein
VAYLPAAAAHSCARHQQQLREHVGEVYDARLFFSSFAARSSHTPQILRCDSSSREPNSTSIAHPFSFQFRLMQPVRQVGCDAFIRQGSMLSCMLMRTCVPLAVQQDGSATGIIQAKAPRTWQNQQSSSFRSDATQSLDNFHFMMKDLVSIDYRLHVHAGRDLWRRQSCCSASSFLCLRP